jgi:signal transduction histidine kinase
MRSFLFVARLVVAWVLVLVFIMFVWHGITDRDPPDVFGLVIFLTLGTVIVRAIQHIRRVGDIVERVDSSSLANRHTRRIEVPFPAAEAFEIVHAAVREQPNVEMIDASQDSLQVRARMLARPRDTYHAKPSPGASASSRTRRNLVLATILRGEGTSSLTILCEPDMRAWRDWLSTDYGTNLENAEAITRAITRRIAERRKGEEVNVRETATEKELAVAKLSLLHAQVEPHFLYNTLASAQVLTRSDPARADQMLGHLIAYLRKSLPRTEESASTVGEELERASAYLEILRIRMGERLKVQIQVPEALKRVPMPPMMLQTLVENSVKHGLEPELAGGTIWIIAREVDGRVAVSVADDGRGFSTDGTGTAIGLNNVRERLRLAYGDKASFTIMANFPKGVTATITLPR